ncbi:hypothetical protein WJX73_002376 [Symbiochloris irregularis]|uniref:Alpha-aminoacylpeptide hydrolase n=1 Tax=Symbiochloris irregularis TaxID=706552 RepID=A0AAW1PC32_9CHLO
MNQEGPDTPGSESHALHRKEGGGATSRFAEDASDRGAEGGGQVFDLSMDYSDDETLLDWEQYAGNRKVRCCGCDVSWLQRLLPCLPWVPPEWWYKYSRRQRKLFGLACLMASVILGTILLAAAMNITGATIRQSGQDGTVTMNPALEQATIQFQNPIKSYSDQGRVLAINFEYTLSSGLSGYYRSFPPGPSNANSMLASTQFETSAARRAFPCFDEPALKATFRLTMEAPEDQKVLFNMPEVEAVARPGGFVAHTFATTPLMSTYLVAFIVGHLEAVTTTVAGLPGTPYPVRTVSVWGTPQRARDLQTALDVAAQLLPVYELVLQVPYPLPKMDLVAIPDFAAGAMENWGLITFRETDLVASNASGVLEQRRIASVIAHEMSHMWFGDLVTCNYWNEIWLNEGFATYWEAAAVAAVRPDLGTLGTFYTDEAVRALDVDAQSQSTHALSIPSGSLQSTAATEAMFDGISYQKGGSVLRMLRAYLNRNTVPPPMLRRRRLLQAVTNDPWLLSVQAYLRARSLKTATAQQLWQTFADTTGEDVVSWMQPWTYRPGYPIVTVTLAGPTNRDVMVMQGNFTLTGVRACQGDNTSAEHGPWWIPVSYITPGSAAPMWHPFSECTHTHPMVTLPEGADWIKLNSEQLGFYRVRYPQPMWGQLASAANSTTSAIGSADLAGLLDDSFALSLVETFPIATFLNLTSTLATRANISEVSPWRTAASNLRYISKMVALQTADMSCQARLGRYVRARITQPGLIALASAQPRLLASQPANTSANATAVWAINGVVSDNYTTPLTPALVRIVRTTVVGLAQQLKDSSIAPAATSLAAAALANPTAAQVDPDIRSSVYYAYVGMGNASAWTAMQQYYNTTTDAAEKSRALRALAYASDPADVQRVLAYSLSADVKSQDTSTLISLTSSVNGVNLQAAWNFLTQRWADIVTKLGGDDQAERYMGELFSGVAGRFSTSASLTQVESVYQQHAAALQEERYLTEAKESIVANIAWLSRNAAPACAWLSARGF